MLAKTTAKIEVPPITIGAVRFHLVGESPLVVHRFGFKAIRQMLDKQTGKAKQGRDPKVPTQDFLNSLYTMPDCPFPILHEEGKDEDGFERAWAEGTFGFPAIGLKAALVRAGKSAGLTMTDLQSWIRIPCELIEIEGAPPRMRMDMVRLESGVADVRFRPEFDPWEMHPVIQFNRATITLEQVMNLARTAGFGVGIGEHRPMKGGGWGTWTVSPDIETLPDVQWAK